MGSLFSTLNIASSGLTAQRLRMDTISNNLANAQTTRTDSGDPFRRKLTVFRPLNDKPEMKTPFNTESLDKGMGTGVKVSQIAEDKSPFKLKWDPSHPDAIKSGPKKGYVLMPNVNVVEEMTDMISAQRSYEANVTVVNTAKQIYMKGLGMLQ